MIKPDWAYALTAQRPKKNVIGKNRRLSNQNITTSRTPRAAFSSNALASLCLLNDVTQTLSNFRNIRQLAPLDGY